MSATREEAQAQLRRLGPALSALARARLGNLHDAQDALQETAIRVLQSGPGEDRWVFTVAANVCRDFLRRRRVRERPLDAPEPVDLDPAGALERQEELDRIRRAIETLDPAEGAPLLMHLLHGIPQREIAEHLDIPVEHLRVRFFRAIRKIRRALGVEP